MNFLFLQPLLVYMSKVDGKFKFSPISVNFLTEATKVVFAIIMLLFQVIIRFVISKFGCCHGWLAGTNSFVSYFLLSFSGSE